MIHLALSLSPIAFAPWVVVAQAAPEQSPEEQSPEEQSPEQQSPEEQSPEDEQLEKEFAATLAEDQAAAQAAAGGTGGSPRLSTAALTNPEISVIGTFTGSWRRRDDGGPPFSAGDDPTPNGFTAQELEITFASDVDPYFKLRAFLTIPNSEGIEVEEAYLLSTTLPHNLLLKAGAFRSAFGRNNEQHLHMQDFARRPLMTAMVGDDGLRAPGAQLSVFVPVPWYAVLYAEALTLDGAGGVEDTSATAELEQFFELSDTWSLLWGLNAATLAAGDPEAMPPTVERSWLFGSDVYLKWKPVNVTSTYAWFALTAEYVARRPDEISDWEGAGYAQVVAQVARRTRIGVRVDVTGLPEGPTLPRLIVTSGSLCFLPSEYSRLRLTVQHEENRDDDTRNDAVMLQLEGAIGAHGAHPF